MPAIITEQIVDQALVGEDLGLLIRLLLMDFGSLFISRIPEGAKTGNKYFVGFYDKEQLVSVPELITGYPESNDAFIGWFMVDGHLQRKGIGSQIFADVRAAMAGQGYDYLSFLRKRK